MKDARLKQNLSFIFLFDEKKQNYERTSTAIVKPFFL